MAPTFYVGQRVSFDYRFCTVRYVGPLANTKKDWLGVEWDEPTRGKHDGVHQGVRYFSCRSSSKTAASFLRPTRVSYPTQSFTEAVRQKYASEIIERHDTLSWGNEIEISGKIVEEVGFEKVRQQLAQLHELKIVIVDGMRISVAMESGERIRDVCPKITELDLSRNLFESCKEIMDICRDLDHLSVLKLNGNRLKIVLENSMPENASRAFEDVKDLSLDEMLLTWEEVFVLASLFPVLSILSVASNELKFLENSVRVPQSISKWGLKSLTLDYNLFTALEDVRALSELPSLESLHLKGNQIDRIACSKEKLVFGTHVKYVDLSYNNVKTWDFVDDLSGVFPGLTALRFSHNPIYENPVIEGNTAISVEQGYMFTLARIASLKTLNFSSITPGERTNAEMFYLSRIGKAMVTVRDGEELNITGRHRRFEELCQIYGSPTVVRADSTINPAFLEARLIKFTFHTSLAIPGTGDPGKSVEQEVPKSFDVYQLKGIVGRLLGLKPLSLRLIWETGEWDPVAGFEDLEEESDNDDQEREVSSDKKVVSESVVQATSGKGRGNWLRREVELENGTRQIGFWVDGSQAKVRVEVVQEKRF